MTPEHLTSEVRKIIDNARSTIGMTRAETTDLVDAAEYAFDAIEAVAILHRRFVPDAGDWPTATCLVCKTPWPCRTMQAINNPGSGR